MSRKDVDEERSEVDQRLNPEFENGDLTEEENRKKGKEHGVETPISELEERDSYLLETAAERDGPQAFVHTEAGQPRDHHPYREHFEQELFVGIAGYDLDREQIDLPGAFQLELEDGVVNIEYSVEKKSDVLADGRSSSFLEYFVGEGLAETHEVSEDYDIQLNMGGDSYLDISMSYDQTSNEGRKKALEKIDIVNDLLAE